MFVAFFSSAGVALTSTKEVNISFEPRHEKMCLRESPTRQDTNRLAQSQKLARVLKFRL